MKFHGHGPQSMNLTNSADPLTFHLALLSGN